MPFFRKRKLRNTQQQGPPTIMDRLAEAQRAAGRQRELQRRFEGGSGSAGVREPRRPMPDRPSASEAKPVPEP
ncbi:MAG: hypothetical protein WAM97_16640 [Acidimicrobiales bacterium]